MDYEIPMQKNENDPVMDILDILESLPAREQNDVLAEVKDRLIASRSAMLSSMEASIKGLSEKIEYIRASIQDLSH
jgi:hypothetical protein